MKEIILKREIIDEIVKYLNEREVIVLYGGRQVGKTCILYWLRDYLKEKNEQVLYIDLEDRRYIEILNRGPESINKILLENGFDLKRKTFVLIDEIQYLESPSNFLKLAVDHYSHLKLIVSGSSSFEIRKKFHRALVGRTIVFEIYGLSFKEFLLFKNYEKGIEPVLTQLKEDELRSYFEEFVLYGSYPRVALISEKEKKEKYLYQIIDTYLRRDVRDIAEVRDIEKFNKLLEVLASQTGKLINIEELSSTARIAKQTVEKYLFILEQSFIIRLVRPYYKNLRSELFKTPKVFFYDSGLVQLLWLKVVPKEILGEIFETAIFSELVKAYGKGQIYYWRTKDRKEIDFVLRTGNKVIPVEAKINFANFSKKTINYFIKKYNLTEYYCIGLRGEKKEKYLLFPWEIGIGKFI